MPNGRGSPDCRICDHARRTDDLWSCRKHNIFIPEIGEVICSSWEHSGGKNPFPNINIGTLYYYSYASLNPPVPLSSFEKLRTRRIFINASVHHDNELGWSIYLSDFNHKYFPGPGNSIMIQLNGKTTNFEIAEPTRTIPRGSQRTDEGTWQTLYVTVNQRIICRLEQPDLLFHWLQEHLHISPILQRFEKNLRLRGFGIMIFLEIEPNSGIVALQPNLNSYYEYRRGHYHPLFIFFRRVFRNFYYRYIWLWHFRIVMWLRKKG